MIRRILALWRIYRRPKPPRRDVLAHCWPDKPRDTDDLQNDTHLERLAQMRRELRDGNNAADQ